MDPIFGIPIYYAACFAILIFFSLVMCCSRCARNSSQGFACALQCFDEWQHNSETVVQVIDRFHNPVMSYDELQATLSQNLYFSQLMQGINQHLAKFCMHYIPSGSMAEGYGAKRSSNSPLASDIDLMLVPSGTGLLAGTRPDLLFEIELVRPDSTANYIKLRLNIHHPASEQWKEMCSFEENGIYLSNARVRMALGNALRADWYTRGTIIFPNNRIIIAQQGPALNVKIQDAAPIPPIVIQDVPVVEYEPPKKGCWGLLCFCCCFISPLFLMVPVYAKCKGKSVSELFGGNRSVRRIRVKPKPPKTETVVKDPLATNVIATQKPKVYFEADFVFALPIQWPVERTLQWEKATISSSWLSSDHRIQVLKEGQCYAVPKPPTSPFGIKLNKKDFAAWNPDGSFFKIGESTEGGDGLPWRISFSKQEETLADIIAECWPYARLGFIGVKAAVKAKVTGLPSYSVKTAFLLFMESLTPEQLDKVKKVEAPAEQLFAADQPQPTRRQTQGRYREPPKKPPLQPQEEIFSMLIDFMVEKLELGVLPHYFIRETNVIEDLKEDDKRKIIDILKQLRVDPALHLAITRTHIRRGCCSCW